MEPEEGALHLKQKAALSTVLGAASSGRVGDAVVELVVANRLPVAVRISAGPQISLRPINTI